MEQQVMPRHQPPRVLIFPLPEPGHINPQLKLAELLALSGIHVTFLITHFMHSRLLLHADIEARFTSYPGFVFKTFSDGLPDDHPRSAEKTSDVVVSMLMNTKKFLKQMLASGQLGLVTCIIVDRVLALFATEVADELQIPVMQFSVINACGVWAIASIRNLLETGQLPIRDEDMDKLVTGVSGMESFLRFRDLPIFCRDGQLAKSVAQSTHIITGAQGLIMNTFEELEGPILAHIRTRCPNIYSIGPMHALLKLKLKLITNKQVPYQSYSNSVFQTDRNCMTWLDAQPLNSVIYVSFGSVSVMTRDQLLEFWYALVNSKKRFLFVIRQDLLYKVDDEVDGNNNMLADLIMEGTKERGCVVEWTAQEEVLEHPAVGAFLTQGGWNSTLESIIAGVPMICWPCIAEQQVTSRYVSEVWKIGMEMKDVCDRNILEKMVNDVMVERRDDFVRAIDEIRRMAIECVGEDGSSYSNFHRLIEDIYKINDKPSMPSETHAY